MVIPMPNRKKATGVGIRRQDGEWVVYKVEDMQRGLELIRQGKWNVTQFPGSGYIDVECSACKASFHVQLKGQYRIDRSKFCPECGAKMIGE